MLFQPRIGGAESVHLVVLDQGNGLQAAGHGHVHVIDNDFLGGSGNGHQAGGALTVHGHAGHAGGQAGTQGALAGHVAAGATLLQSGAHDHVLNSLRVDAGALHGVFDGMATQRLGLSVVEGAPVGFANRGAGGGNDDGFSHDASPD